MVRDQLTAVNTHFLSVVRGGELSGMWGRYMSGGLSWRTGECVYLKLEINPLRSPVSPSQTLHSVPITMFNKTGARILRKGI